MNNFILLASLVLPLGQAKEISIEDFKYHRQFGGDYPAPVVDRVPTVAISKFALPKPTVVVETSTPVRKGYPVRTRFWTGCSNWQHMTQGPHKGKYDPVWLQSLSWAELQSLHADDHEGRVNRSYVVPAVVNSAIQSNCPGGVCPSSGNGNTLTRRRLFR